MALDDDGLGFVMPGRVTRGSVARAKATSASLKAEAKEAAHPSPDGSMLEKRKRKAEAMDDASPSANDTAKTITAAHSQLSTETAPKPRRRQASARTTITLNFKVGKEIQLPHGLGTIPLKQSTTIKSLVKADNQSVDSPSASIQPSQATVITAATSSLTSIPTRRKGSRHIRGLTLQTLAQSIGIPGHQEPRLSYLKYGHTPGETPFPDMQHPTVNECEEVYRRLAGVHGEANQDDLVPPPSLQRAGCGDVHSILDALIRTYLSSNTSDNNSSLALVGLTDRFGLATTGVGKDSVDYGAIWNAPVEDVETAIRSGGMAPKKSKSIKALLDMVYAENEQWKAKSLQTTFNSSHSEAAKTAHQDLIDDSLSLQYVNLLDTDDAILHMVEYPGIGIKTAACVALYCLRRQCFPVDTHVLRICKGLGWTPPKASDNRTFSHCEYSIPDHLKYGLHHLFVRHGKDCARCRAGASPSSERWAEGCVLDDLLDRDAMKNHKGHGTPQQAEE